MFKKRSTDFSPKRIQCLGRVVECFILIKHRTKERVFVISDDNFYKKTNVGYVKIALILIRYDKHPFCGLALDKNKPSITRPKHWLFIWIYFDYLVS